jgi:predicted Rossmann-fold nucleotide-binding protein
MSQSIEKSFFHDFSSEFDDFARDIAKNRYTVLCGGVTVGLIGEAIRLVKKYGGKVNGAVIDCEKEDIHAALDSVAYFNSYAERQAYMFSEVNKIVFLPGGLGTLHELCDLLIKAKMDFFQKNVFFFDFCDFWRPFFDLLNRAVDIGFIEAKDVGYTVINRQLGFSSVFEG